LIPIKRTSHPQISYLNKPEMDALLAASDVPTAQGRREHALLLFMFNSGARASEAAQLRIGDVDWHTRSVSITGKGNRQRRCPLWQSTLDELRSQTEGRTTPEPVFLNRFHQTMTRSGIHALVKRCAARACTMAPSMAGKNVHPHVIRHTTASLLLQAGIDINTIRGWLGHVSLTTTNICAEINLETKARALAACEVESDAGEQKHWRDQPDLMAFLRTL
jgi:integrase/recombinase XerD